MILEIALGVLVSFITYKFGHSQGQISALKKLGSSVTLYAGAESARYGFEQNDCHVLSRTRKFATDVAVKVTYEEIV